MRLVLPVKLVLGVAVVGGTLLVLPGATHAAGSSEGTGGSSLAAQSPASPPELPESGGVSTGAIGKPNDGAGSNAPGQVQVASVVSAADRTQPAVNENGSTGAAPEPRNHNNAAARPGASVNDGGKSGGSVPERSLGTGEGQADSKSNATPHAVAGAMPEGGDELVKPGIGASAVGAGNGQAIVPVRIEDAGEQQVIRQVAHVPLASYSYYSYPAFFGALPFGALPEATPDTPVTEPSAPESPMPGPVADDLLMALTAGIAYTLVPRVAIPSAALVGALGTSWLLAAVSMAVLLLLVLAGWFINWMRRSGYRHAARSDVAGAWWLFSVSLNMDMGYASMQSIERSPFLIVPKGENRRNAMRMGWQHGWAVRVVIVGALLMPGGGVVATGVHQPATVEVGPERTVDIGSAAWQDQRAESSAESFSSVVCLDSAEGGQEGGDMPGYQPVAVQTGEGGPRILLPGIPPSPGVVPGRGQGAPWPETLPVAGSAMPAEVLVLLAALAWIGSVGVVYAVRRITRMAMFLGGPAGPELNNKV